MSTPRENSKPIDWSEVKQRLETARIAIERIWAPTAEETKRVLEERALALAREPARAESDDEWSKWWNLP